MAYALPLHNGVLEFGSSGVLEMAYALPLHDGLCTTSAQWSSGVWKFWSSGDGLCPASARWPMHYLCTMAYGETDRPKPLYMVISHLRS